MGAKSLIAIITRFAGRLRFPQLFAITAALFLIDLAVPDFVPRADEILLALLTLILGSLQDKKADKEATEIDGTQPSSSSTSSDRPPAGPSN